MANILGYAHQANLKEQYDRRVSQLETELQGQGNEFLKEITHHLSLYKKIAYALGFCLEDNAKADAAESILEKRSCVEQH